MARVNVTLEKTLRVLLVIFVLFNVVIPSSLASAHSVEAERVLEENTPSISALDVDSDKSVSLQNMQQGQGSGPGGIGSTDGSSSLKVWLNGAQGVFGDSTCVTPIEPDGANAVGCWKDQSGNGANAIQANETQRPYYTNNVQNGVPGLTFDGANDQLAFDRAIQNDFTIITVFKTMSLLNRNVC